MGGNGMEQIIHEETNYLISHLAAKSGKLLDLRVSIRLDNKMAFQMFLIFLIASVMLLQLFPQSRITNVIWNS